MHRTRTGKHLALTERDMEIFRTLRRYRFLRSTYLHAFVGGASEKRFVERLGNLFHEGYLDRPTEQWRFADVRCMPVVHELGKGGVGAASAASEVEAVTWFRDGPHRQFEHMLMVCEVLASIELATRGRSNVRLIPWPEILVKAPESTRSAPIPFRIPVIAGTGGLIPDGLFGLEYARNGKKTYRFFALEADRGTMPIARTDKAQTSYFAKLSAYREIINRQLHRSYWGIPNLLVLTVTASRTHMERMLRAFPTGEDGSAAFLFQSIEESKCLLSPFKALFIEPWLRPNEPALCIADAV
jgi:hypothetical protein